MRFLIFYMINMKSFIQNKEGLPHPERQRKLVNETLVCKIDLNSDRLDTFLNFLYLKNQKFKLRRSLVQNFIQKVLTVLELQHFILGGIFTEKSLFLQIPVPSNLVFQGKNHNLICQKYPLFFGY